MKTYEELTGPRRSRGPYVRKGRSEMNTYWNLTPKQRVAVNADPAVSAALAAFDVSDAAALATIDAYILARDEATARMFGKENRNEY